MDYALSWGLDAIRRRASTLAENLRDRLAAIPGVAVHDQGAQRCAIVTFTKDGLPASDVSARLREAGINTLVTSVESARFDLEVRGLNEMVRASPHYYNTEAELERLCVAVEGMT